MNNKHIQLLVIVDVFCQTPCFLAIQGNLVLEFYPNQLRIVFFERQSTEVMI
jgi:hypothetical protein